MFTKGVCWCRHTCCEQEQWELDNGTHKLVWRCENYETCIECHPIRDPDLPWDAYGLTYDDLYGVG